MRDRSRGNLWHVGDAVALPKSELEVKTPMAPGHTSRNLLIK